VKFNTERLKVLYLGRNKSMFQYILEANWPDSNFTEKDLEVPDGH